MIEEIKSELKLARQLKHGPGWFPCSTPLPTPEEALALIEEALKRCDFNWITGREYRDNLRAYLAKVNK